MPSSVTTVMEIVTAVTRPDFKSSIFTLLPMMSRRLPYTSIWVQEPSRLAPVVMTGTSTDARCVASLSDLLLPELPIFFW